MLPKMNLRPIRWLLPPLPPFLLRHLRRLMWLQPLRPRLSPSQRPHLWLPLLAHLSLFQFVSPPRLRVRRNPFLRLNPSPKRQSPLRPRVT